MGHINPAGYDWVEDDEDLPERLPVVVHVPEGSLPATTRAELADGVQRDGNGVEVTPPVAEDAEHVPSHPEDESRAGVEPEAEEDPRSRDDLVEEARVHGLPVSGSKRQIRERLVRHEVEGHMEGEK